MLIPFLSISSAEGRMVPCHNLRGSLFQGTITLPHFLIIFRSGERVTGRPDRESERIRPVRSPPTSGARPTSPGGGRTDPLLLAFGAQQKPYGESLLASALSAEPINRRMASLRDGKSGCRRRQSSILRSSDAVSIIGTRWSLGWLSMPPRMAQNIFLP
jgi:hypothetical protein